MIKPVSPPTPTQPQTPPPAATIEIVPIDLGRPADGAALVALLDHYARDPMGGGHGLSAEACAELPARLARQMNYFGFFARAEGEPVGVINCFEGFSTFAARPLLNVHDIAVLQAWRGRGVGRALLARAEALARTRGCCKLTLEVLSNNTTALNAYQRAGFEIYQLDPAAGQALFMHKWL